MSKELNKKLEKKAEKIISERYNIADYFVRSEKEDDFVIEYAKLYAQSFADQQNKELKYVLSELVRLKSYKDKYGKDDHYVVERPLAWYRAKESLNK